MAESPVRNKLRRVDFDHESDDDFKASHERVTEHGGYAHTKTSRMKISAANKGNTPWNKGKNRPESTKNSISAGVKARNRRILMQKLAILKMSEDEWNAMKKQTKYIRERNRKARQLVKQHKVKRPTFPIVQRPHVYEFMEPALPPLERTVVRRVETATAAASEEPEIEPEDDDDEQVLDIADLPAILTPAKQARDVTWTPHEFDTGRTACPTGGPGGLICCAPCSAAYTSYMTKTVLDVERQKMQIIKSELGELLTIEKDAHKKLKSSIGATRNKPAPILREA